MDGCCRRSVSDGAVALDEIVVPGWDLAVATGQPFEPDEASVQGAHQFAAMFSGAGTEDQRGDAFGTEVAVHDDAPPALHRWFGIFGRDAAWSPPTA